MKKCSLPLVTFFRSLLLFVAGFSCLYTFGENATVNALVIDQGVDLSHSRLARFVNLNKFESDGRPQVDDDLNGFVDDISGWNAVSRDAVYMPDHVLSKFSLNPERTKNLLDIYTRLENGDLEARKSIIQNPSTLEMLGEILGLAHGTHVAGIVDANSSHLSRLQSLNVFVGSKAPQSAKQRPEIFPGAGVIMKEILSEIAQASANQSNQSADPDSEPEEPKTVKSIFDNLRYLQLIVAQAEQQEIEEKSRLSAYLGASTSKIVNLSLGAALANYRAALERIWADEVQRAGLPEGTRRNAVQDANFQYLFNGMFEASRKAWGVLFGRNSDVLFVLAAGNDGVAGIPDAGDLDINPVTPAVESANFPNVITVAATDKNGVLTDFSCFSASKVNIGAWGKAVLSLAPGENFVAMSGTSMAAPLVAGVASRVRAINPLLTAAQTRTLLEQTSKKLAALEGKVSSGGFIDAEAAYAAAQLSLNLPITVAIEKSLGPKFDLRSRLAFNMLRIGTLNWEHHVDPTHRDQLSQTDNIVVAMIKKVANF